MTPRTATITSYDVPQWLKEKINSMATIEEVEAYRNTVKSPNKCKAGDVDLMIWNTCTIAMARPAEKKSMIEVSDHDLAVIEWVNSDEYDEE